jgi:hypothetical protein
MQSPVWLSICALVFYLGDPSFGVAQKAPPAPAISSAAKPVDVEKTIRQSAQQFVDAFNKGDSKAIAALWAEDGVYRRNGPAPR